MKAIVIGGGIGGMAAALSLRNEGIEVEVYEQAPALAEIGAGLQIAPSAGRVLERLGLGAELGRLAITMQRLEMRDLRSDRLIHSVSPDWGGPSTRCTVLTCSGCSATRSLVASSGSASGQPGSPRRPAASRWSSSPAIARAATC